MPVTVQNKILYNQNEMTGIYGSKEELNQYQVEAAKRYGVDVDKAREYYRARGYESCRVPITEIDAINEKTRPPIPGGKTVQQPVKLSEGQEAWAAKLGVDPDRAGVGLVEDEQTIIPRAEREAAEEKKKRNSSHWNGKNWN